MAARAPDDSQYATQMEQVTVNGREDDLVGVAESATQGTVGSAELEDRPLLRAGEILETVPGVIITMHAGGGKASQYFTRGFNLDHGTDFAIDMDGMPLNLPSHAHGQGYADMNIVIPELIERLDYEKGPYYATNGDFATAGAAHIVFAESLMANIAKFEGGTDGYTRGLWAGSQSVSSGTLVEGFEVMHENGPWAVPDDYSRYNGFLRYAAGDSARGYSITGMAYHGVWNSTDQVAASAVSSGRIPLYGSQDPSDGGYSQRYSIQGEWHNRDAGGTTSIQAYSFHYDLNLFSDFTYYLDSPQGDQFEQSDNRNVLGLRASRSFVGSFLGLRTVTAVGAQVQNSWIDLGLYQTLDRERTAKADYDGNVIPAATKVDAVEEFSSGVYVESKVWWTSTLRSEFGFREDLYDVDVRDLNPVNSGNRFAALASPKLNVIFGPLGKTEFYVQSGYGFHSNDARTDTATVNPDGTLVGSHLPVLVPSYGAEVGVRVASLSKLQSTLSIWGLHNDSELYFNGIDADSGQTTASQQPSRRYGVEFANYFTPTPSLTLDLDYANSSAHFVQPTTEEEDVTPGGTLVGEAIHVSLTGGVTLRDPRGWEFTLRGRYFGPRPLTSSGNVKSGSTFIVNLGSSYRVSSRIKVTADVMNVLNRHDHDIDYYYRSRNSPAPRSPAPNEVHFHPVEPIELRTGMGMDF